MLKISLSEQGKQTFEAALAFLSILRLLFFKHFLMGPWNCSSLKYWANDEPGFMTDLFYSTKILLNNFYTNPPKWVWYLLTWHTPLLFNCDVNRGCLVYMFSLRFSGSKFLINLRQQFCVYKIFFVYVKIFVYKFLQDLQSFMFKITNFKMCNLCSRLLFY